MAATKATEEILLLLGIDAVDRVDWLVRNITNGKVTAPQQSSLQELAETHGGLPVTVFVPSEHILSLNLKLPAGQKSVLKQALPYLIEEHTSDDIAGLHFGHEPLQPDGNVQCWVVGDAIMRDWLTMLQDAGLDIVHMLPDFLLLPDDGEGYSIYRTDERVLARNGQDGFACHPSLFGNQPIADDTREVDADDLVSLLEGFEDAATDIDLMQHRYAPDRAASGDTRLLRYAAVLFLLAVVIYTAGGLLGLQRVNDAVAHARAETLHVMQETFPGIGRIEDATFQAERELVKLQGHAGSDGGDFMMLYYPLAETLHKRGDITLESIQFRGDELRIQLKAPSVEALEEIQTVISGQTGTTVRVLSASRKGNVIDGRLLIGGEDS